MARTIVLLAVAALAVAAAGCNGGGRHPVATLGAPRVVPCKLGRAQHRAIARSLADIRRLRRIQVPVQKFSQRGGPNENTVTGDFLVDLGSARLPVDVRSRLIHLAKTAANLCGECASALEASEPFLGNREPRCG